MGRRRDIHTTETLIRIDRYNRPVYRISARGYSTGRGKKKGAYRAAAESASKGLKVRNVAVEGRWSLTDDHDLRFRASGSAPAGVPRAVVFRTDLITANRDSVGFRVRKSGAGTRTLSLSGKWRADSNNRLVFDAASSSGKGGSLRFQGAWQAGKRGELVYGYKKPNIRGKERVHKLVFRGQWDLGRRKISYRVGASTDSVLTFRARLAGTFKAKEPDIRYVVGIRFKTYRVWRERKQIVSVHGAWKVEDGLRVSFEAFGGNTSKALVFRVEKAVRRENRLILELRTYRGRGPRIRLELNRNVTRDAKLFLAVEKNAQEHSVMGGVTLKF